MLDKGLIRIRPLSYYARAEGCTDAQIDAMEGTVSYEINSHSESDLVDLARFGIRIDPHTTQNLTLSQVRVSTSLAARFYAFCTSSTKSARLMKDFQPDSVTEMACVEIASIESFCDMVCFALEAKGLVYPSGLSRYGKCSYLPSRELHWEDRSKLHGAFIKDLQYQYQHEVRCIWQAYARPLDFVDLELPETCPLLSPVQL